VDLSRVVPFLTCKHTLEYCLLFARRAASLGIGAITVTGGDATVATPRCVPRSRDLRALVRAQVPGLSLGAWVNPYKDPVEQVALLMDPRHEADYFLTQVVSHHGMGAVDGFLEEAARRGLAMPGLFGVFHYRSGNRNTLERLNSRAYGRSLTTVDRRTRSVHLRSVLSRNAVWTRSTSATCSRSERSRSSVFSRDSFEVDRRAGAGLPFGPTRRRDERGGAVPQPFPGVAG
jgi:hypothetical protein